MMKKILAMCISVALIMSLSPSITSAHRNSEFTYEYNGTKIGKITNPENDYGDYYFPVAEMLKAIDPDTKEIYLGSDGAYHTSHIIFRDACYEFKYGHKVTVYDKECKIEKGEIKIDAKQRLLDDNKVFMPAFIFKEILGEGTTIDLFTDRIIIRSKEQVEKNKLKNKVIVVKVNDPWMYVNDEIKELDLEGGSYPVIRDGRTLLPIATIIKEFGGKVNWDGEEQRVTISLDNNKVEIWIGKTKALVNGLEKTLDVSPSIIGGRTMVPLRFVSENLGLQIGWDNNNQTAGIYHGDFNTISNSYASYFKYKSTENEAGKVQDTTENDVPLDINGNLIKVGDIVQINNLFAGKVEEIQGSKIHIFWNKRSALTGNEYISDKDLKITAMLLSGIKWKESQWGEAKTVSIVGESESAFYY